MKNYTKLQNFLNKASVTMAALRLRYLWLSLLILVEALIWRIIFTHHPNNFHLLGLKLVTILNLTMVIIGLILILGILLDTLRDTILGGD